MRPTVDKLDEVLGPLEELAERRLSLVGAPHCMPADGKSVGELRRWAIGREYHDRVAAGIAIACAYLRQHIKNMRSDDGDWALTANSTGLVAETARIAEWGVVLRLLESSDKDSRVEVGQIEELFPDIERGRKSINSAKKGHEVVHGSKVDKERRWAALQGALDKKMRKNPRLSLTQARKLVAKETQQSFSTVRRHTDDPREK